MSSVLEALNQAETPRQRLSLGSGFGLSFDVDPAEGISSDRLSPALPRPDMNQPLPIFTLGGPSVFASALPASPAAAAASLPETAATAAAAAAASTGDQATDGGDPWTEYLALAADGAGELSSPANKSYGSPLLVRAPT